jgi:hypothetical protein
MRHFALPIVFVSLVLLQSSPVATQPFEPLGPRPPAILNGCSENALFAILNSGRGGDCLRTLLPRASNVASEYSVFCQGAQWGCCVKSIGFGACKHTGTIPSQRVVRPPVAVDR